MGYQGILFDLDGTLLPMDNEPFIKSYFGLLAKDAAAWGYAAGELVKGLWQGVEAMVKNDGSATNEEAFWQVFSGLFGPGAYGDIPKFDNFYRTSFSGARSVLGPDLGAAKAVALAREKAEQVILATNPLFPRCGTENRMGWVGLRPENFDMVTTYEDTHFCKPNPCYYMEILEKRSLDPKKCLMVGNDVEEDIIPAQSLGMDTFLVTNHRICKTQCPQTKQGDFNTLLTFLEAIEG